MNKKANDKNVEKAVVHEQEQKDGIWQDERFQHLIKDPRFKNLPKTERKVKIDKRFQSMFTDNKFKVKYTVDKYGRHVNQSNSEDLRKYYELDSDAASSEDEDADAVERQKEEKAIISEAVTKTVDAVSGTDEPGENDLLQSDGEEVPTSLRERLCNPDVDYARGQGRLVTDSSSDDDSSEEEEDPVANIDHIWGELDANAEMTEESTHRLAVCNMDWDRMRGVDLMVLFSSFLPPGGSILSVKIYPSEYGKQRLAAEEHHGPLELVGLGKRSRKQTSKSNVQDSEDEELVQAQDSEAEEGDDYHMEKLREYQLNRLRYFYAVVDCDSVNTADKIYKECDGIEYESSATRMDLRFIPDDTSFDDDLPDDICTDLPDNNSYKPRQFTNTALQQVKVDLTWDETAVERKELGDKLSSGKMDEVNDKDLRKIVAYSSEEEDDDEEEQETKTETHQSDSAETQDGDTKNKKSKKKDSVINKYKALLAEINKKESDEKKKKYEMEFTWEVNEEKNDENAEAEKQQNNKKNKEVATELTPIEKVMKKRSEKNKKRKEERKRRVLLAKGINPDRVGGSEDSDSDTVPDGIDMTDPYFAEEFANGQFVDTRTKAKQKQNTRKEREEQEKQDEKEAQELSLLLDDHAEDSIKNHFSLEKILQTENETKSKRKRRKQLKKSKSAIAGESKEVEDNFQLNVNDDRFNNVYTSHLFNIDPTHSHFKKTKGMDKLIEEKLKRRDKCELNKEEDSEAKRPRRQIENSLLVKSLKRKLQQK